jgi:UDP-3-O-[3-hydroxymyristoyl] glucosamine N-acyltransferase
MAASPPRVRRLSELAAWVGGEVVGNPSLEITGVNGLAQAGPTELSLYASGQYRAALEATRAGAILIGPDASAGDRVSFVRVPNAQLAFAKISALFNPRPSFPAGVRPGAWVHPEARVHPEASVMTGATVERGASIGARAVLFPGVFVGEGAAIGEECILYPNVTVRDGCLVGCRVILHSSSVIGADGFGFAFDPSAPAHVKIPQVGIVRIEDDVEIGACSCIDRATFGETVVGRGTKIDNLVQIAHNVKIGRLTILCGQVGISGSTEVGSGTVLAGQVGVVGHIRIGDKAKVGAQAGVAHDVEDGATVTGYPAIDHRTWLRSSIAFEHFPELIKELRELRQKVEMLEKKIER